MSGVGGGSVKEYPTEGPLYATGRTGSGALFRSFFSHQMPFFRRKLKFCGPLRDDDLGQNPENPADLRISLHAASVNPSAADTQRYGSSAGFDASSEMLCRMVCATVRAPNAVVRELSCQWQFAQRFKLPQCLHRLPSISCCHSNRDSARRIRNFFLRRNSLFLVKTRL